MWVRESASLFIGIVSGFVIAGGVFALITALGILNRMADKTHTASHVGKYELAVAYGGIIGTVVQMFELRIPIGVIGSGLVALAMGTFVGCLATALAESLNVTAVFTRRIRLKKGIGVIVLVAALGKMCGSLVYFIQQWHS